jgi:7,8-dihydropterin-6-yl-methyl-4-(beta-D-ribofuranosyl)aminobenzene 5'-phosphate synthase
MDERMLILNVRHLGLIVFDACSHASIVKVCTHARNLFPDLPIHCVMGGLHPGGVMEAIIPDTVEGLRPVRDQIYYHWSLHRLARSACAGQCIWRIRQPVSSRYELYLCG